MSRSGERRMGGACGEPVHGPNCPCEAFVHPRPLAIPAGLAALPRQIATFPEFRRAMLAALPAEPPLTDWRARGRADLGVMLLEMWAYVSDVLAFYDEVIASEAYLRTARLRPSLRKLVALLGYLPRPAVAATVELAAFAEGRQPLTLPAGTAFRSGAFPGGPPQVFELLAPSTVHPLNNRWNLQAPVIATLGVANPSTLNVSAAIDLAPGAPVLITVAGNAALNQARVVAQATPHTVPDGGPVTALQLTTPAALPANTLVANIQLFAPTQKAGLWTISSTPASAETVGSSTRLTLDALYRPIRPGDLVLVSKGSEYRWHRVSQVDEAQRQASAAVPVTVNGSTFNTPGVSTPVTRLLLDADVNAAGRKPAGAANWTDSDRAQLTVHYGLIAAGTGRPERKQSLAPNDTLQAPTPVEAPGTASPGRYLLEDKNQAGTAVGGSLSYSTGRLTLDMGTDWTPALTTPVQLFGNVVRATRGESVTGEVLGSGDAAQRNQGFKLKKKPLTFTAAPAAPLGVASSLRVYVDGVQWQEVPSFFGAGPADPVFIVRQNDEGESILTFGDGLRGARLPSGRDNVVANYRFGAGAASPPAGSITQLARPVKGLQSVRNPAAASGGAEAEPAEGLRTYAPRSALLLGRAVSLPDMIAAAAGVAGVRAVQGEWRWHAGRQRPLVQMWYIGAGGLEAAMAQTLRALTDPATPIEAAPAVRVPAQLSLDVEIDPRHIAADVVAGIGAALLDNENGLLAPERIGIGTPLYRSRIFSAVLGVPGTRAVRAILWNGAPFDAFAVTPGPGCYFDVESGGLTVNGTQTGNG